MMLDKKEAIEATSFVMGIWAIMLLVELAIQVVAPPLESGTEYRFVDASTLRMAVASSSQSPCGTATFISDGNYLVEIDERLPEIGRNFILRHENCHVQQYKRKANMTSEEREIECYIRMWLP